MTATLLDQLTEQQLEDLLAQKRKEKQATRDTYKDLVDETVSHAIANLKDISIELSLAKGYVFAAFKEVMSLKEEVFGIREGQRTHTFSTDKHGITLGYRVNDGWDDTATAGVAKVTQFIQSLAKDDNSGALVETVFNLLKKDVNGNLRANRVIELSKLTDRFADAGFTDGVNIIMNAYKPVRTCWFVDAYWVNAAGEKVSIPLSISAADFPEGFDFGYLLPDATKVGS